MEEKGISHFHEQPKQVIYCRTKHKERLCVNSQGGSFVFIPCLDLPPESKPTGRKYIASRNFFYENCGFAPFPAGEQALLLQPRQYPNNFMFANGLVFELHHCPLALGLMEEPQANKQSNARKHRQSITQHNTCREGVFEGHKSLFSSHTVLSFGYVATS